MKLSIHQPSYFPWLGLLHKISQSDVYMVMDDVQLTDKAYQHRNIFLTLDGKVKYLTIPFAKKSYLKKKIRDLKIYDSKWCCNHVNFLKNNYAKHRFYDEIFPYVEQFYLEEYEWLIDAIWGSMQLCLKLFDVKTQIVFQSEYITNEENQGGNLVLDLVQQVGADCYISGLGAQAYLDDSLFNDLCKIEYSNFRHPHYSQKSSTEFVCGLSSLDVLFNLGVEKSQDLLKKDCVVC